MKLVDILARELKEWPEGAECVDQSSVDKEVCAYDDQGILGRRGIFLSLVAENPYKSVTRAQWQAAVDALKAGEQAWDGEGLPPVGLTVETVCGGCVRVVEILCVTERSVFMREPSRNAEWVWSRENPGSRTFRPLRTAEQIAAQEREKAIAEMCLDAGKPDMSLRSREQAAMLYEAGWRKQVKP